MFFFFQSPNEDLATPLILVSQKYRLKKRILPAELFKTQLKSSPEQRRAEDSKLRMISGWKDSYSIKENSQVKRRDRKKVTDRGNGDNFKE